MRVPAVFFAKPIFSPSSDCIRHCARAAYSYAFCTLSTHCACRWQAYLSASGFYAYAHSILFIQRICCSLRLHSPSRACGIPVCLLHAFDSLRLPLASLFVGEWLHSRELLLKKLQFIISLQIATCQVIFPFKNLYYCALLYKWS